MKYLLTYLPTQPTAMATTHLCIYVLHIDTYVQNVSIYIYIYTYIY
jgi:hypothetical protein